MLGNTEVPGPMEDAPPIGTQQEAQEGTDMPFRKSSLRVCVGLVCDVRNARGVACP